MIQRQLKVMIATFPYGGVGASSLETPDIRHWETRSVLWMSRDSRVQRFDDWLPDRDYIKLADTPISMCRNQAIKRAMKAGADVLVWIDSDMRADCELGLDPEAVPFLPTAFDFLYNHWERGPVVLAAPYCGSSPVNNVFAFHWDNERNPREDLLNLKLAQYSRHEAYRMAGIQPVAAIGTGLMMMDMRIFKLLKQPYCYYTFDEAHTEKQATEDCTFTRDVSMLGHLELGYEALLCTWSSWAGHWKPELVRKPSPMTTEMVNDTFKTGVLRGLRADERVRDDRSYFAIEHRVRVPGELGEGGKEGEASWRFLGMADGALQFEGDFIAPEAKQRFLDEHGVEFAMSRAGYALVPSDKPLSPGEKWNVLLMDPKQIPELIKLVKTARVKGKKRTRVLEIGSWVGLSAQLMADRAGADVTCIDRFEGAGDIITDIAGEAGGPAKIKATFLENTKDRPIKHIEKTSHEAVNDVPDGSFDFVWVDGDHSMQGCLADIVNYTRKVRVGGIIAGHDHNHITVAQAVQAAFGNKAKVQHDIWSIRVTKALVDGLAKAKPKLVAKNRRRTALPQVSKVAAVHKKVVRNRHHTVSRMPTGRSRVSKTRSRRKAKN